MTVLSFPTPEKEQQTRETQMAEIRLMIERIEGIRNHLDPFIMTLYGEIDSIKYKLGELIDLAKR